MSSEERFPRIRCSVCDKLVDRIEVELDRARDRQTIKVWCHGDRDRMEVSHAAMARWSPEERRQWEAIGRGEVEGVAFTTNRIGEADG